MDADRRRIIIQEIQQWRRGRLLPDHYCDFLMNLYVAQDGERTEEAGKAPVRAARAARVAGAPAWKWISISVIFSFFFLIVLHFSSFHPALQIALCLVLSGGFLALGRWIRPRNEISGLIWTGLSMLTLAGSDLYLLQLHGIEAWGWKALSIGLCAVLWVLYGMAERIPLLHFSGWVCLAIVYWLLLRQYAGSRSLGEIQIYWLPFAGLFFWAGWFAQRWSKSISLVLMGFSILLALLPEITYLADFGSSVWLQTLFVGKLVIGGGVLYLLRKYWIAWVA